MVSEILKTFEGSITFVKDCIGDLSDAQMVQQPPGAPNHAMWTLGHLAFSCQGMAEELGVARWLPDEWESLYGFGSVPLEDAGCYPSKVEMLVLLDESAQRLADTLIALTGEDLARPLPDEQLPTMGHLLMQVVVAHTAYHVGQLSAWRRSIGLAAVGVFV